MDWIDFRYILTDEWFKAVMTTYSYLIAAAWGTLKLWAKWNSNVPSNGIIDLLKYLINAKVEKEEKV